MKKSLTILLLILPLAAGAGINEDLLTAIQKGDIEKVSSLIEKGADVNVRDTDGVTALILASQFGYADIVKLLIDNGANVNARDDEGRTALMKATIKRYKDIVKLLKAAGAKN